jgi:hypothetical protein
VAEFFVRSAPSLIRLSDAASAHEAAEIYLEQPAPVASQPPACFVQATGGQEAPRMDDTAVEFWPADSAETSA